MDVDAVVDELYALPPGEFVAARDDRVRQAKEAGDRDSARAVAALRRPTVVAWLANLLVRRHPDDVTPFLELGAALRDATATLSGPELRDLSRQRHQLVHALVLKARALGESEGRRVGEDSARGLEETLHAALADPDAAQQLLDGRLTGGLSHAGFGEQAAGSAGGAAPAGSTGSGRSAGTSSTPARRRTASEATSAEDERRAARRARIERDLGEAWGEARRTAEARDAAEEEAREVEKRRADAAREVRRLQGELKRAELALAEAVSDGQASARVRDRAEKEADRARMRVTDLQSRLDQL